MYLLEQLDGQKHRVWCWVLGQRHCKVIAPRQGTGNSQFQDKRVFTRDQWVTSTLNGNILLALNLLGISSAQQLRHHLCQWGNRRFIFSAGFEKQPMGGWGACGGCHRIKVFWRGWKTPICEGYLRHVCLGTTLVCAKQQNPCTGAGFWTPSQVCPTWYLAALPLYQLPQSLCISCFVTACTT